MNQLILVVQKRQRMSFETFDSLKGFAGQFVRNFSASHPSIARPNRPFHNLRA